jgi:hypothetical protein
VDLALRGQTKREGSAAGEEVDHASGASASLADENRQPFLAEPRRLEKGPRRRHDPGHPDRQRGRTALHHDVPV